MEKPTLVVMAAGMGSRYGGLKQIDPVGPNGEIIIHYSLYDAMQAGFRKFVFVIKEENQPLFEKALSGPFPEGVEIVYAYQKLEDIPSSFSIPEGRTKPWGTAHACYAAREYLSGPFVVINADDYYGKEAFRLAYEALSKDADASQQAMVAFRLKNTMTEHGTVSRGICRVKDGFLREVVEHTKLEKVGENARDADAASEDLIDGATPVSMNFWAFRAGFIRAIIRQLDDFLRDDVPKNPLKAEYFLPRVVTEELEAGRIQVRVLETADRWLGVTYQEDRQTVRDGFRSLNQEGVYPSPLWKRK